MDNTGELPENFSKTQDTPANLSVSLTEENELPSTQRKSEVVERIHVLRNLTGALKRKLKEEKDLWRKEIDELCRLQRENEVSDVLFDSPPATPNTLDFPDELHNQEEKQHSEELAIMEYDKKITKCQQMLSALQHEKVLKEQKRQYAVRHYKKRLMEVEKMCNMELARVKQTATFLEPLNRMASEWTIATNESNRNTASLSMNSIHTPIMAKSMENNLTDISADVHLSQGHHSSLMSAGVQLSQTADTKREHVTVKMAVARKMPLPNATFWHEDQGDASRSHAHAFSSFAAHSNTS